MANPYVVVVGNICAGKSTFVNRFSASHSDWCGLPEVLSESQRSGLCGPDSFYLYASFFADFYIERHRFSREIHGPLIQESCLESSSLFPRVYYENKCFSRDKYCLLESKYAKYLNTLPRPDFYIYLYVPLDVLRARAEIRKEPARTVSIMLMPRMQDRLEDWVETHVTPDRLFRIDSLDIGTGQIDKIFYDLQSRLEVSGNRSL
jgi:deoxyadenosine/deoxycytidine kinase